MKILTMIVFTTFASLGAAQEESNDNAGPTATSAANIVSQIDNGPLTLDRAVSQALAGHPLLQAAEAEVRAQQHRVFQATRKPNPTVGYLASEVGNEGQAGQQGVFLSQNIIRGDKLNLNGQIRQRDVSVAAQELDLRRQQLIADAQLAYFNVAVEQERLKLLGRLQLSLDQAAAAVGRLVKSGELSLSASLQSRLEAQRNQMQISRTETQLTAAQSALGAILGWDQFRSPVAESALKPGDQDWQLEALWSDISVNSPELRIANCRYDRTQWQVRRAQAEPIPDLQTQWSIQQDAATHYAVLGVQIGVELPIRDNNAGAINAARADTWQTHYQIDAIRRSLRRRLVTQFAQRQAADQQLRTIKSELEQLARDNLQTTQKAFALGEATYLDLLNAQRAYISLSLDTLLLYRQLVVSKTHLQTYLVRASDTVE